MSPSSAGVKPVPTNGIEQYIGSYLISTTSRPKYNHKNKNFPKNDQQNKPRNNNRNFNNLRPNNDGWAGGVPLYSMPNYPMQGNMRKINSPAPQHDTFQQQAQLSRLAMHTHGVPLILTSKNSRKNFNQKCNNDFRFKQPHPENYAKNGNNFISSDLKDNCVIDTLSVTSDESSGSNNSETCLPRIIKPRKRRKKDRKPATAPIPECVNEKVVVQNKSDDVPNLNHEFDDVKEVQNQCSPTSCQCKLCDPSGQIWNTDSLYIKPFNPKPDVDAYIIDKMVTALRRSWSDPSPNPANVGVIGEGRLSQEKKDTSVTLPNLKNVQSNCNYSQKLNISTEIVTSPNGHRDLEIKFLSFSSLNESSPESLHNSSFVKDTSLSSLYDDGSQSCFKAEE